MSFQFSSVVHLRPLTLVLLCSVTKEARWHTAYCTYAFMALKLCFSAGQTNLLDREDHLSHQATTGLALKRSFVSNDGENLGSKAVAVIRTALSALQAGPATTDSGHCREQSADSSPFLWRSWGSLIFNLPAMIWKIHCGHAEWRRPSSPACCLLTQLLEFSRWAADSSTPHSDQSPADSIWTSCHWFVLL